MEGGGGSQTRRRTKHLVIEGLIAFSVIER
jgi:hypothetical protein